MIAGMSKFGILSNVSGIRIGTAKAHIRYADRKDLVIFELNEGSNVSAVFTQNHFCAAPVQVAKKHIQKDRPKYLVINTGNANSATGIHGLKNAYLTCEKIAELTGCAVQEVLPFSTGVIGEQLPIDKIFNGISTALKNLNNGWNEAALGIMTTDTIPKGISEQLNIENQTYTITGICKGSGMIRPNMATMLAFVATDIPMSKELTDKILKNAVSKTFNRITVDGDMSTNDSCVLISTGLAGGVEVQSEQDPRYQVIYNKILSIMLRLAQSIIKDGEGATKFITVNVAGGRSNQECCDIAYSIAHSPLVKTALSASDPNWGRLLMAIGKAGIQDLNTDKIKIKLNEVLVFENGVVAPDYQEAAGISALQKEEINIVIDLGMGDFSDTVYTCDLSEEYIKINADYRS